MASSIPTPTGNANLIDKGSTTIFIKNSVNYKSDNNNTKIIILVVLVLLSGFLYYKNKKLINNKAKEVINKKNNSIIIILLLVLVLIITILKKNGSLFGEISMIYINGTTDKITLTDGTVLNSREHVVKNSIQGIKELAGKKGINNNCNMTMILLSKKDGPAPSVRVNPNIRNSPLIVNGYEIEAAFASTDCPGGALFYDPNGPTDLKVSGVFDCGLSDTDFFTSKCNLAECKALPMIDSLGLINLTKSNITMDSMKMYVKVDESANAYLIDQELYTGADAVPQTIIKPLDEIVFKNSDTSALIDKTKYLTDSDVFDATRQAYYTYSYTFTDKLFNINNKLNWNKKPGIIITKINNNSFEFKRVIGGTLN